MTNQYGCLTIERHEAIRQSGTFLKVFVNGRDVTFRCLEADDKVGRVVLLCHDKDHRDWRVDDARPHIMPDADDRPCIIELKRADVDIKP